MDTVINLMFLLGKGIATVFLVVAIIAASFKAHPRTHNPKHPPLAEYGAGFIVFGLALMGLYYLYT